MKCKKLDELGYFYKRGWTNLPDETSISKVSCFDRKPINEEKLPGIPKVHCFTIEKTDFNEIHVAIYIQLLPKIH